MPFVIDSSKMAVPFHIPRRRCFRPPTIIIVIIAFSFVVSKIEAFSFSCGPPQNTLICRQIRAIHLVRRTSANTALRALSGRDIRNSRSSYAPIPKSGGQVGAFETIGIHSFEYVDTPSNYAPPVPKSEGQVVGAFGNGYVSGRVMLKERSSYAPYSNTRGNVGSLGEIGADTTAYGTYDNAFSNDNISYLPPASSSYAEASFSHVAYTPIGKTSVDLDDKQYESPDSAFSFPVDETPKYESPDSPASSFVDAGPSTAVPDTNAAAEDTSFSHAIDTPTQDNVGLFLEMGGRHYQLTELEDSETASSDVLLNEDSTITLGMTNGPYFKDAWGTWEETFETGPENKRSFSMNLTRKYHGGMEQKANASKGTYIGEFPYDVQRTLRGEVTLVGGSHLAVDGDIYDEDEIFGDRRVGFFNMIDATEAREEDGVL